MLRLIVMICLWGTVFLSPLWGAGDDPQKGGSLVIIGGALELDNQKVYQKFIDSGGGKENTRIAIIPAASSSPVESGTSYIKEFGHYGVPAEHIKIFPVAVKDDASTKDIDESTWSNNAFKKELAAEMMKYNAVFFVGGDQARYLETLKDKEGNDSPLLVSIRKIYEKGGVIGGTSAGAAIMSDPMICGGTAINALITGPVYQAGTCPPKGGVLLTTGLGFLKTGLVDQHFIKRGRFGRLLAALLYSPQVSAGIGIGIDEDTAAVYCQNNKTLEVIGRSGILILDTRKADLSKPQPGTGIRNIILHYLEEGDIYHTENGEFTINPGRKKIAAGKEYYKTTPLNTNIFAKDAIQEIITTGLVDNLQTEAVGIAFTLDPPAKNTPHRSGKGVKLVFRKDTHTTGYWAEIDGKETYSALYVYLDILPITIKIME